MTDSANLAIVRRLLEEGWNQGRLDVVDELVAPTPCPPTRARLPAASPGRTRSSCTGPRSRT